MLGRPIVTAIVSRITKASMKWVAEPAHSTTTRCHTGLRFIALGASTGSTSSREVMPVIRQ